MKSLYLIINAGSVIVPFLFSFHPKIQFYKKFTSFFLSLLIGLLVFIPWDIIFTDEGIWGFNERYILGILFFNLPIEEILFFVCIPFACVFSYHCFTKFIKLDYFYKSEPVISKLLIIFLALFALINYNKQYTSVTFILLSVFILILKYGLKVKWLHKFYFSYLILLIPFFIVNGILTGTGPDEPVVWYNNNENLGIRLLTIPFEDVFYGMLLLMIHISVYEYFAEKNKVA